MTVDSTASLWPAATLLIGFLTKSFTDWLQDRRIAKRDALARLENRKGEAKLRQIEFQRANLLELQETAARFVKAIGSTYVHDVKGYQKSGEWSRELLPEDVNENDYQNRTRSKLLVERVADPEARDLGRQLLAAGLNVTMAQNKADAERAMAEVGNKIDDLNLRIGVVLRALDEAE